VEWALAGIAVALIAFGAVSKRLEGTPLTPAIFFVGIGLLAGAEVFGLIDTSPTGAVVKPLAEATLTVVLFADASRVDLRTLQREHTVPVRLLGFGLPLTIALGGLLAAAIFGALSVPEALVIAVVLAPTDAALGQAVVTEPRLPSRIRQGLNVESGLNDGICVPLLYIVLAIGGADAGELSASHAVRLVVEEIGYGIVAGLVAGALAAIVLAFAANRDLIERSWARVVPVAGAALAYGIATPLGGSGFIAAFVAGLAFGFLRGPSQREDAMAFSEELGGVLDAVTFLVFGAVLLTAALDALSWRILLYAVLSLTLIRMAPVAVAMLGTGARRETVAFLGWFGPRGLASIVFAAIVVEESDLPNTATIVNTTYVTVGLSVLLHGVTAAPLARRYAAWFSSHPADATPAMESVPAGSHRLRWRSSAGEP